MAAFVLVHGAAHGGWCWKKLTPLLRAAGHEVHAPTLTGLGERAHLARPEVDLALHVQDVVNVLFYEDLREVILVGHSYGGAVITGVADRAAERLAQLVYLDAALPDDGESLLDLFDPATNAAREERVRTLGEGWRIPLDVATTLRNYGIADPADAEWLAARLLPQPFATFRQALRLARPPDPSLGRTFIYCTRKPGPDSVAPMAARARAAAGWRYREIATGHDAMVTMPHELADLLLDVVREVEGGE